MGEMPTDTPMVRTARVSDKDWQAFRHSVETESEDGFRAYVRFETGPEFLGADEDALRKAYKSHNIALVLAADELTFDHPDQPVLCIDPEGRSPSFRARVQHLWIVENNVSIGNLLFEEMAEDEVENGWLVPQGV